MNNEELMRWIKKHEGYSDKLYKCTANKWTIGWGRNIEDNGLSLEENEFLFKNDVNRCKKDLEKYEWYYDQPKNIQCALLDMCFNLGINRLIKFKKMISYIEINDYTNAAREALNSKWASQVKTRAKDVAMMIRDES